MTGRARGFQRGHAGRRVRRSLGRLLLETPAAAASLVLVAFLAGICPAGAQQAPADAAASSRAVVRWKEILTEGNVTRVRLETSSLPRYEVSSTAQPPRAEVQLFDVQMEGLPARVDVKDGTIDTVETRALPGGAGRLSFLLAGPGEAEVVPWGGGLDILVHLAREAAASPAAQPEGFHLARRLTNPEGLAFALGAPPSNLSAFLLSDGKRLVVDAEGVEIPTAQVVEDFAEGPIVRVRAARQDGRVRAVLEARDAGVFDGHRLEKTKDGFSVLLAGGGGGLPAAKAEVPAEPAVPAAAPAPGPAPAVAKEEAKGEKPEPEPRGGGTVLDLGFRQEGGRSLVEIVVSKAAPHVVRQASAQRVVVDLLRTTLPDKFKRALDTTAFPGPVRLIAAYPRGGAAGRPVDTRLVVDLRKPAPYRIERQAGRITLVFEGGAPEPSTPGVAEVRKGEDQVVVVEGKPGTATSTEAAPGPVAPKATPAALPYAGRRLSMDFMDADIRNVLRLIGEVSGLNMVTGDDVQGKVTLRLVDVPWDQALDVILKTKGLGQVREGNVVRIAPADKLAAEMTRVREAEKGAEEKAPLVSDILPVNYASAKELLDKVKAVLTVRGTVTVDDRTNALLVKDVSEKVEEARTLVRRLDTPTPQVLIEARIVEVSSNVDKSLGIQWGGKYSADTAHGNATNWAFPNSIGLTGSTSPSNNFAVNLPAAVDTAGALSLTLGHVNDILRLDLRLSALESANQVRVVSSPRVTTLDNRTAEISQGQEIPFTTSTQEKIETKSIEYKMTLNVTPHVTSDRSIIMKIDLKKDDVGDRTAADGKTPSKNTKSATTEVLVKDGETTVIGGIITDDQRNFQSGIPFFSKIPVLGWLFKNKEDRGAKQELVIFITPKIVTPTPVIGSL